MDNQIKEVGRVGGVRIYSDPYMEDNKVLRGRKENWISNFFIANPKTAEILFKSMLLKNRKEKLRKINATNT